MRGRRVTAIMRVTLLLALSLVAAACGRGGGPGTPQASAPQSGVVEVALEGTEFLWRPNSVTVQRGRPVRFRIVNKGAIAHTFVSDPAGIRETREFAPGEQLTVEWTAPNSPGTFEFWCGVPGHREAGMTGTLTVK
ncbi:MAG: cupredoxin domain-containing protein [bacterium]